MHKNTFFTGQPIFSQLLSLIPKQIILKTSKEYQSDRYYKKFKSYEHLVSMLYCSFHKCTSLRELTTGMLACYSRLSHLGINYVPRRSTLGDANKNRSSEFFSVLYNRLYQYYYGNYPDSPLGKSIESRLFIIDSTTIKLFTDIMKGLGSIPVNGKRKGGAKAHVLMKADQDVPCFVSISDACENDRIILKDLNLPKGSILTFDKGYNNYRQMEIWRKQGVNWVTRMVNTAYYDIDHVKEITSDEIEGGILSDQIIIMGRPGNKSTTRLRARKIEYWDFESGKKFIFLTNNTSFNASTIASIYKRRWQIEILFKRLKQNYPLQNFLGDNENAIKIQIWAVLITDLLLKIVMDRLTKRWSYANIAGIVRLHLMTYINLFTFLNKPEKALQFYKHPEENYTLSLFPT
jgi:hypothetical protein